MAGKQAQRKTVDSLPSTLLTKSYLCSLNSSFLPLLNSYCLNPKTRLQWNRETFRPPRSSQSSGKQRLGDMICRVLSGLAEDVKGRAQPVQPGYRGGNISIGALSMSLISQEKKGLGRGSHRRYRTLQKPCLGDDDRQGNRSAECGSCHGGGGRASSGTDLKTLMCCVEALGICHGGNREP